MLSWTAKIRKKDVSLKNRDLDKHVKQHHHDLRVCEENIKRLADDITRIERMFDVLWQELRQRGAQLAIKPSEQELKCSSCGVMANRYHITAFAGGYYKETICVDCYINHGIDEED